MNLRPNPATGAFESITFANGPGDYEITLTVRNSANVSATTRFTLAYEPQQILRVNLATRQPGSANVQLRVTNLGATAATDVSVTAIGGIAAKDAEFTYNPGVTAIPFIIPATATLRPGASVKFNLNFRADSGDPASPFSFVLTVQAKNGPAFSTTIQVPVAKR